MTEPTVNSHGIEAVCRSLTRDLLAALRNHGRAKEEFAAVTQAYQRPGRHEADAEQLAAGDPRRQKAGADCAWWHGEALLAATALTALRAEQTARREPAR